VIKVTWDPHTYPTTIRAEIHDYDELQDQVVEATTGISVQTILELGVGTGETASRVLQIHPEARLTGIDSSAEMLRGAAEPLPQDRVTLLHQDLNEPFPDQSFDLVISALAIHHLEAEDKARLFREIAKHLEPGGRFVMADVVVPNDPAEALIENEPGYDFPSTVDEQLIWMSEAGFSTEVTWTCKDLAVLKAHLRLG
jgi:tRNA (cmo5U34)-methyltransferase